MPTSLFKCFIGEIKVKGTKKALLMDCIELFVPLISSLLFSAAIGIHRVDVL